MVSLGHAKRLHRRVQLAAQLQQLFTLDATFTDAGQVVAAQVVDAFAAVADFAGGATLLGSGLGRDSALATVDERSSGSGWLAYIERGFEAWRAYYEYLPRGKTSIEYTMRLNNVGTFSLPPTRVEALYAPEVFGASPNAAVKVGARP